MPVVRTPARPRPRPRSRARRRCRSAWPRPWSPGRAPGRCRWLRSGSGAVLNSPTVPGGGHRVRAPGRCRRSVRWRGPGRGHQIEPPGDAGGPELASGPGRLSPGSNPRAVAAIRTSARSRPRPWSRTRRCKRERAQAEPAVRLAIDASPHGPGRGHQVEPPGRCGGGGPELASGPGRGHQVRAPRAMPAVRTSARGQPRPWSRTRRRLRAAVTGFEPLRAVAAVRTSAAPAVRLAIDGGPHSPGRRSPGRAPGRCRWSRSGSGAILNSPTVPGGGHLVRPRAMPAIRTPARSRPAVRLTIDADPHGPGRRSPGRAPPGGAGGLELASGPGRGHQVRAPRAMPTVTRSTWTVPALRPGRALFEVPGDPGRALSRMVPSSPL